MLIRPESASDHASGFIGVAGRLCLRDSVRETHFNTLPTKLTVSMIRRECLDAVAGWRWS
ncbi:MAG TPA: hypothetical protein VFJ06_03710 [Halococcus sp.]|nr:hypothetical protein [Halococcus sp.]